MKRIVQLLTSALVFTAATTPALSLSITASLTFALSNAVDGRVIHPNVNVLTAADFAISKFDKQMVDAFSKAWRSVGNGSLPKESVVLILRMADGSFSGRDMGSTNEHKQFTFRWHPATIAIVHTHPNSSAPKPQDEDIVVADKYHVPIFTITSRGMYAYDPGTRKLSKITSNLDWLDVSKFSKSLVARQ